MDKLPAEYLDNMKKALGDEFGAFLAVYDQPAVKALRFNPRKARLETIGKLCRAWKLEPVPWCPDGWYYEESGGLRPGLSPYHDAGVFYIQEPSAMLTAESAAIGPDDIVLDLCAAPGGKSTQAAAKCRLLVANEPIPGRARILSSNIERMGFENTVVTSAYPDRLAACIRGFFTRVIVDAPCSGEGMMRKDGTAIEEWSPANVRLCISRQKDILEAASVMLAPGGRLAYSTCTFEYGENEGQIRDFLLRHPDFRLLTMETLYPHRVRGEGHFCAVLEKTGVPGTEEENAVSGVPETAPETGVSPRGKEDDPHSGKQRKEKKKKKKTGHGRSGAEGPGDTTETMKTYLQGCGIHVLRSGLETGLSKSGTDAPSHAEILAGRGTEAFVDLHRPETAGLYLRGSTIDLASLPEDAYTLHSGGGWLAVKYDGYAMGLGKLVGSVIKNHYPKGLRHL